MIRPGLVSITFRSLNPGEIIDLAGRAGLEGIEWGGDVHVPHGDLETARRVSARTREAGLAVAAYGSYYEAGAGGGEGPAFDRVLATAVALGAPTVRVWAGRKGSAEASPAERKAVTDDLRRIGAQAGSAGLRVATEWHGNTLTDTPGSAVQLMREVGYPRVGSYWQTSPGEAPEVCRRGLTAILPHLVNLHVFQWSGTQREPLARGGDAWTAYLRVAAAGGRDAWALLEYVAGDTPEQLLADAATLRDWLLCVPGD